MEDNGFQTNVGDGWIKLFRSIRKHWIWNDANKLKWWLDILMEVNHSDKKVNIGFDIYECKTGQSIMSRRSWAKRWNVSKTTVDNFFKLLLKDKMISIKSLQKTSQITVCNFDVYQQQQATKKPQEDHVKATTVHKQELKELNNEKNILYSEFFHEIKIYFEEKFIDENVWLDEIRKLVEIDKHPIDEIKKAIIWARKDSFWENNFMSLVKLRKKNNEMIPFIDVFIKKMNSKQKQPMDTRYQPTWTPEEQQEKF